ncbi:MAG: hypothetical protein ACI934_000185 [Pseudohongiellaceae bacterium]|jgi:hypothetical protein
MLTNDDMSIDMEMTVTDPVDLLESVTFDYYFSKIKDGEFFQAFCSEQSARLYLGWIL